MGISYAVISVVPCWIASTLKGESTASTTQPKSLIVKAMQLFQETNHLDRCDRHSYQEQAKLMR